MNLNIDARMESYYQKFIELQEKLRKSEEERLKLEMKFNEMVQISREEEQAHYRKLRNQYKKFLEEDRKRQERNEKMLRTLERIETRIDMLTSKTGRLKLLRRQYMSYLQRVSQTRPNFEMELDKPTIKVDGFPDKINNRESYKHPAVKNAIGKTNKEKIELLDKYLQNLSAHKTNDIYDPNEKPPDYGNDLKELEVFSDRLHAGFDSDKANSIAEDIMNSIYSRHYRKNDNLKSQYKPKSKYTSPSDAPLQDKASMERAGGDSFTTSHPNNNIDEIMLTNANTEKGINEASSLKNYDPYYDLVEQNTIKSFVNNTDNDNYSNMPKVCKSDKNNCRLEKSETLLFDGKSPNKHLNDVENKSEYIELEIANNSSLLNEDMSPNKTDTSGLNYDDGKFSNNQQNPLSGGLETCAYEQVKLDKVDDKLRTENLKSNYVQPIIKNKKSNWEHAVSRVRKTNQHVDISQYDHRQVPLLESSWRANSVEHETVDKNISNEVYQNKRPYQSKTHMDPTLISHEEKSLQNLQKEEKTPEYMVPNSLPQSSDQYDQSVEVTHKNNERYEQSNNEQQPVVGESLEENESYDKNLPDLANDNQNQFSQELAETDNIHEQYNPYGQSDFNDDGQIISQYDTTGQQFQQYDGNGTLLQQYETNDQIAEYDYDPNGQPVIQYEKDRQVGQSYAESNQILPQYNANEQPIVQYEESGQIIPQYDENGQLLIQYDENGQLINQYDGNGQLFNIQYEENGQVINQYNTNEQPNVHYEENGQIINQYDANGQLNVQYDENGQVVVPYDVNGQVVVQYDENGEVVVPQYDCSGETVNQYTNNGQVLQQYDQSDDPSYQYNSRGELIPEYDQFGRQILYDQNGVPVEEYNENCMPITQYNEGGHVVLKDELDPTINQYTEEQPQHNNESLDKIEQLQQPNEDIVHQSNVNNKHVGDQIQKNHMASEELESEQRFGERVHDLESLPDKISDVAKTTTNVLELLDTDTENSAKQNVSNVTNDSDFDFSNG